ncbi:eukaryotic cytochrome b561 domain-containing protein [Phthorimaea operculella]|nr:eukaryotic cytochrome b561 domain-containing protein [Phthorimaea operculella]
MHEVLYGEPSCSTLKNRSGRSSRNPSPSIELATREIDDYRGDKDKHFKPLECCVRRTRRYPRKAHVYGKFRIPPCSLFHLLFMIFCQTVMGGICIATFAFTVLTLDWHVFLCCEGWHFYMLEAILAMAVTNTWGNVRTTILRRVRVTHLVLQFFGVAHVLVGNVIVLWKVDRRLYTVHCLLGIVATIMQCVTLFSGPLAIFTRYNQSVKFFHACLGLPTFLLSTVVLELGLFHKKFQLFVGSNIISVHGLGQLLNLLATSTRRGRACVQRCYVTTALNHRGALGSLPGDARRKQNRRRSARDARCSDRVTSPMRGTTWA